VAALAIALAFGSRQAFAINLGQAVVSSDTTSPLHAEVPLRGLGGSTGIDLDSLRVDVPKYGEQLALGMNDPILPSGLQVQLLARNDNSASIYLSTPNAAVEPALRFMLRVRWPKGQVLRKYELIIDPPTRSTHRTRVSNAPRKRATAATLSDIATPAWVNGPTRKYGPVAPGETLSAIVERNYSGSRVPASELMRAIVARNPGAFIGADPGKLMMGMLLDLPALDQSPADRAKSPTARIPSEARKMQTPTADRAAGSGEYVVAPGDTLFRIARRLSNAPGSRVQDIARALFEGNPLAFVNDDMNRLKAGATLRWTVLPGFAQHSASADAQEPAKASPVPVPDQGSDPVHTASRSDGFLLQVLSAEEEARGDIGTADAGEQRQQERLEHLEAQVELLRSQNELLNGQIALLKVALAEMSRQSALSDDNSATATTVVTEGASEDGPIRSNVPTAAALSEVATATKHSEVVMKHLDGMFRVFASNPLPLVSALVGVLLLTALMLVTLRNRVSFRQGVAPARARADEEATLAKLAELRKQHKHSPTGHARGRSASTGPASAGRTAGNQVAHHWEDDAITVWEEDAITVWEDDTIPANFDHVTSSSLEEASANVEQMHTSTIRLNEPVIGMRPATSPRERFTIATSSKNKDDEAARKEGPSQLVEKLRKLDRMRKQENYK
jgi:Tfp pilus assembly protein FimV